MEVRLQGQHQFPLGRAPAVLAHPRTFGDVEFALVGSDPSSDHGQQGAPVEVDAGVDTGQVEQSGHEVLVLVEAGDAAPGRQLGRVAQQQRHVQDVVIDAVVIEPALVIVKGLAVVAVDRHDGLVEDPMLLQRGEDRLDGGVHVGDGAVILGDDIVLVRDARRQPGGEKVAEGLEGENRLHRLVAGIALIAVKEHALVRFRREVGRMGIHVAQKEEKRLVFRHHAVDGRYRLFVQQLGLGQAAFLPGTPGPVAEILVEAATAGVAVEADADCVIPFVAQDLRQRLHLRAQGTLVTEGHDLRREYVHAGQHRGVGAGRGNMSAESVLEKDALGGEAVQVGAGKPRVSIATHVIGM